MLATLNAAALGYLVSSFSPNEQVANAVGPPVFIILLLYGTLSSSNSNDYSVITSKTCHRRILY